MNNSDIVGIDLNGNYVRLDSKGKITMDILPAEEPAYPEATDYLYKEQFENLKDFLTFKGIEINEEEFNEFVESRKLAEKLSKDPNAPFGFPSGFKFVEKYGAAVINTKAIAKVKI